MRSVYIAPELLRTVRRAAFEAYPEECCGFLYSSTDGREAPVRGIVGVSVASNGAPNDRGRRFAILPGELLAAEQWAAARGVVVGGFYHSHPDRPPRPSTLDQERAWPWYVYVILSSASGGPSKAAGAFELDPDPRAFREIEILTDPGTGGAVAL